MASDLMYTSSTQRTAAVSWGMWKTSVEVVSTGCFRFSVADSVYTKVVTAAKVASSNCCRTLGQLSSIWLINFQSQRTEADRQVKVQPWPCIPEDVFRLIKKCTHHERRLRPSLQDVYTELRSISLSEEPDGE